MDPVEKTYWKPFFPHRLHRGADLKCAPSAPAQVVMAPEAFGCHCWMRRQANNCWKIGRDSQLKTQWIRNADDVNQQLMRMQPANAKNYNRHRKIRMAPHEMMVTDLWSTPQTPPTSQIKGLLSWTSSKWPGQCSRCIVNTWPECMPGCPGCRLPLLGSEMKGCLEGDVLQGAERPPFPPQHRS